MLQIDMHLKINGNMKEDDLYEIPIYSRIYILLKFWDGPWIVKKDKLVVVKEFGNEINGNVNSICEEIFRFTDGTMITLDKWKNKCVSENELQLWLKVYNRVILNQYIPNFRKNIDLLWKIE